MIRSCSCRISPRSFRPRSRGDPAKLRSRDFWLALVRCESAVNTTNNRFLSTHISQNKPTESYLHQPSSQPLQGWTLGQLLDVVAESVPDNEAIVSCSQNLRKSYAQLRQESDDAASVLLKLGLERNDRIAIWGHNTYEWVVCTYAAAKAGLVLVPLNPAYKAMELDYALKKVQVRALIVSENEGPLDYAGIVDEVLPELQTLKPGQTPFVKTDRFPDLKAVIQLHGTSSRPQTDTPLGGMPSILDLSGSISSADRKAVEERIKKVQFDDPSTIMFTSGTTGSPKAAVLTHYNIVNNAYLCGLRLKFHENPPRYCVPAPLFHCMGLVVGVMSTMAHRGTVVLPSGLPKSDTMMQALHQEKCTMVIGSPTMYLDMLHHPDFKKYNFSSLNTALFGGASCLEEVLREVKQAMKISNVGVGYGTTENSPVVSCVSPQYDSDDKCVTTVGRPLEHTEVKIVNDAGEVLPLNTPGEVWTRGPQVFLGYWQDPEKTAEVITPTKWYRSGDVGVMDEEGYLKIVGRIKDMIIRGGENVYPVEIESFLHTHPAIAEVYVIGVPDKRLGEQVCAWIKVKQGQTLSEQEVKDFCDGKISHYKIPKYVLFAETFPLTQSGKVQKNKLQDDAVKMLKL